MLNTQDIQTAEQSDWNAKTLRLCTICTPDPIWGVACETKTTLEASTIASTRSYVEKYDHTHILVGGGGGIHRACQSCSPSCT